MVDWTGVSEGMAREIMSQGEKYLQAQLQLALAADQRATTMAGLAASVASVVVAGVIAYWDKDGHVSVLAAGLAGATALMVSAGFAAWAARPVDFNIPGNHPEQWLGVRKRALAAAMGGEAENYQEHIAANDAILGSNQRALRRAGLAALLAPIAALATWVIVTTSFSPAATSPAAIQSQSSSGSPSHKNL